MRIQLILLTVALYIGATAQVALKSSGTIPSTIYLSSAEKIEKKKQLILDSSQAEARSARLARLKFNQTGTYMIQAIKNNAKIYINDSYTKLVNTIADELLEDKPEVRKSIRLFAYKSPYVNAFSTDQGDIFFTVGLLSHLDNEAELAFVVGHEISHFIRQHGKAGVSERIKIAQSADRFSGMTVDQGWEAIHSFTRSLEKEADLLSLSYYLATEYDTAAIFTGLDKLRTASQGYTDSPVDYHYIWGSNITVPEDIQPSEMNLKRQNSKEDRSSTHPEIEKRIAYCSSELDGKVSKGNKLFKYITPSDFESLRLEARKEQTLMLYNEENFVKAIYNSYLIGSESAENASWSKDIIDLCLKQIVEYRTNGKRLNESSSTYKGELYKLHYILTKSASLNLVILQTLKNYNDYAVDTSAKNKEAVEKMLTELATNNSSKWKKAIQFQYDTSKIKNAALKVLAPQYERMVMSELFKEKFGSLDDFEKEEKTLEYTFESGGSTEKMVLQLTQFFKRLSDTTIYPLEAGKVIVCNPYYLRANKQLDGYVDHDESYKGEEIFLESIRTVMDKSGVEYDLLDVRDLDSTRADQFDDISDLGSYLSLFDERDIENKRVVPTASQYKLDSISEKYGTDYVIWMGARSFIGDRQFKLSRTLFATLLFPQYLAYGLTKSFIPESEFQIFYVMIDLKQNKVVGYQTIQLDDHKDNANTTTLYLNTLLQKK